MEVVLRLTVTVTGWPPPGEAGPLGARFSLGILKPMLKPKVGRPPKKATGTTTLTFRVSAEIKNKLIEQARAYDITITEYLISLVEKDAS